MAARGTIAKSNVINILQNAFGEQFISVEGNNKVYVWAEDGGEQVQIAITLTCPKNPVQFNTSSNTKNEINFEVEENNNIITEEERNTVVDILEKLGL